LHQVRIEVAIAVELEQRDTAAHDLGQQIAIAVP
jgi:hypothetical protein